MNFSQIYFSKTILETDDFKYVPTSDEIRKFNQVRKGSKPDYSKDFHNKVLQNLYKITIRIKNEKLRSQFSKIIFENMGSLKDLILEVEKKNELNPLSDKYKELKEYLEKIKGELK